MSTVTNGSITGLINRAPGIDIKPDYTDAASAAAKTNRLQQLGQKALLDIGKVSYEADGKKAQGHQGSRPQLAPPAAPVKEKLDSAARFVGLMASIVALIGDAGSKGLESRLAALRAMSESIVNANKALGAEYEAALAELEAAVGAVSTTQEQLEAAQARVQAAQGELALAEATLAGLDPESPEYADAVAIRDAARANLQTAQGGLTAATSAHQQALAKASAANVKLDELSQRAEMQGALDTSALKDMQKAHLNAAAQMTLLMARFAELMGEGADKKLEADQALAIKVRDTQLAGTVKKAKEFEELQRKAEAAAKAMGCIGKMVGALMTVGFVVSGVVTGGASLALVAVGIALMAGDMGGKAITGTSFMDQALKPLMDHVLSPIINALGNVASSALEKAGVAADKAKMIGDIVGAIAGALLMIAVMAVASFVTKGAASRVGPKMAEMISKVATKVVPDLLKQSTRTLGKSMGQLATRARGSIGLKSDSASLARYANNVERLATVIQAGGTVAQSSFQVKTGMHQEKAAQAMAQVAVSRTIVDSMVEYIRLAVEMFGELKARQTKLIEDTFNTFSSSLTTALQIARNTRI